MKNKTIVWNKKGRNKILDKRILWGAIRINQNG